jgi:AcrR family transcriptional regulator
MDLEKSAGDLESVRRLPPRERLLAAASDLFYRYGIRAVGVDAIAEAAGTNKMTLYRHFASKDELVAEYLRGFARDADHFWSQLEIDHPEDPPARLQAWLRAMGGKLSKRDERGCAFCNAAVELPEREHPARRVIETHKTAQRDRLVKLCGAVGLAQPESLADELFLLFEGARISVQSVGPEGPAARFVRMGEAIIASHMPIKRR